MWIFFDAFYLKAFLRFLPRCSFFFLLRFSSFPLLEQRHNAREQRLLKQFLSLSRHAQAYVEGIEQRRVNPRHHLRKIVALSEIYGVDAVDRAIQDGIAFAAYSCEYIANILEMRARETPEPGALHLTRQDLLDIEIPAPDLSLYEGHGDEH
ncbi:hypothetical protein [Propionivibrio sp.]|uniref:hypothetical protein n=1 Tax=Propionivibrio sp. TaxID=2212460 RepID=UPI003BEFE74A